MEKVICQICKRDFKNIQGFRNHLSRIHKMKTKDYYDKYFRKENEGICYCKKETSFRGLLEGYHEYCSRLCASNDPKYREKLSKGISKYYKNNPEIKIEQSKKLKSLWDDPIYKKEVSKNIKIGLNKTEVKIKRSIIMKEIANRPEIKENCKQQCIDMWKDLEKRKERLKTLNDPKVKNEQIRRVKNQWKDPEFRKFMMEEVFPKIHYNKISKPQLKLYELIKDIYPTVELEFNVKNFFIDIAIPDKKIAVEYDGSYWHQDKEADNKRQKIIESLGWKFIRYVDYIPTPKEFKSDMENL